MATPSTAEPSSHVYELRTYHAAPGKLEALSARFRDLTEPLFRRHGLKAIGYWTPADNKDNLFIYILDHKSREDAAKNWAAFQADDDWKKVKAETESNGPLQLRIDSVYLSPTEYSNLK